MTATIVKPTKKHARKVLELVSHGLVKGLGVQEPGKMCVEAAVCAALGLPHSDKPPCVGEVVRQFKISLNDSYWSSNDARAKGMKRLAVAQLGSNTIDQVEFARHLTRLIIQRVVPIALRAAASIHKDAAHRKAMEEAAVKCEHAETDAAASYASDAASSASYAASAAASDAARAAARAASAARDNVLEAAAECGVVALELCGSPGVKWLDLCEYY